MSPDLVLASASPRRSALLRGLGIAHRRVAPRIDERPRPEETAVALVRRLAAAKAAAVPDRALVLAADTEVVLDGRILGKPADDDDARGMLAALAGRAHDVLTGVCLRRGTDGRAATRVAKTVVRFRPLTAERIDRYVATGEPRDKAGGYGIQGLGALLVEGIEGSWSNVVGLPLDCLDGLFAELGDDLWTRVGT